MREKLGAHKFQGMRAAVNLATYFASGSVLLHNLASPLYHSQLIPHGSGFMRLSMRSKGQSWLKRHLYSTSTAIRNLGGGEVPKAPKAAIVRGVPDTFSKALAMDRPASPINLERAREQHAAYVEILRGLVENIIELPADNGYPDCPFVEDTAIVIGNRALITRPGAISRRGEEVEVRHALLELGLEIAQMESPGTIDGGDVLYASGLLFAGKSRSTKLDGKRKLMSWLLLGCRRTDDDGIRALASAFPGTAVYPIQVTRGLHLKSVLTCVAPRTLLVEDTEEAQAMLEEVQQKTIRHFKAIGVSEAGAANILRVGDTVLYNSSLRISPKVFQTFAKRVIPVDISEFHKVDGGLTCLSILVD